MYLLIRQYSRLYYYRGPEDSRLMTYICGHFFVMRSLCTYVRAAVGWSSPSLCCLTGHRSIDQHVRYALIFISCQSCFGEATDWEDVKWPFTRRNQGRDGTVREEATVCQSRNCPWNCRPFYVLRMLHSSTRALDPVSERYRRALARPQLHRDRVTCFTDNDLSSSLSFHTCGQIPHYPFSTPPRLNPLSAFNRVFATLNRLISLVLETKSSFITQFCSQFVVCSSRPLKSSQEATLLSLFPSLSLYSLHSYPGPRTSERSSLPTEPADGHCVTRSARLPRSWIPDSSHYLDLTIETKGCCPPQYRPECTHETY
jgi:hypothetical protein